MKSLKTILIALVAIITMAIAPVLAGDSQGSSGDKSQQASSELRSAAQRLASRSQNTKGAQSQIISREAERFEKLAKEIEAGGPVDQAEIDRMIAGADHGEFYPQKVGSGR